ncbi:O-methyltransferase [Natronobiforma cellulositropha]|uniref:O-methyltransferase n=1 Tax=Natronobiforma cellulositropha TaxID=1679076 RepID=UPI0021D59E17|nr:O-methyltransferase [Natronobiforma cellulositropha]
MAPTEEVERYVRAVGPDHDELQERMAAFAAEHDFPIIGPGAGGVLRSLAAATRAERIFEFGSGFGYSASWFLAGSERAEIVLTEFDRDELEQGRRFLESADLADRATFEHGDAMEAIDRHDGPFDVVLIDHQKTRYADAFEAVREKVPVGGVVVADNVMGGPVSMTDLLAYVDSGASLPDDANTEGIAAYLERVRADEDFHTVLVPVGNGLAVSTRERA